MSSELATQVGALVGTSLLLFLVTMPKKEDFEDFDLEIEPMKKYSSYHRQVYERSSNSSVSSSCSSVTSNSPSSLT